jgi:hypothetical protein
MQKPAGTVEPWLSGTVDYSTIHIGLEFALFV